MKGKSPKWPLDKLIATLATNKFIAVDYCRIDYGIQISLEGNMNINWYDKSGRAVVQGKPSPQLDRLKSLIGYSDDRIDADSYPEAIPPTFRTIS